MLLEIDSALHRVQREQRRIDVYEFRLQRV